jgi:ribosomal protein L11 methyltransferase
MYYTELSIEIGVNDLDPLLDVLSDMVTAGFEVEDPRDVKELQGRKSDWDYIDSSVLEGLAGNPLIRIYFSEDVQGLMLMDKVLDEIRIFPVIKAEIRGVTGKSWESNWKKYFKPKEITDRFVIKPSWESYEFPDKSKLVIEIDPGMAFGTGTHPTTVLCIGLMEKYQKCTCKKVLDVGSGSGILSVAAALLGAKDVRGIDIDPGAVMIGRENVKKNHLEKTVKIQEWDFTKGLDYKADMVVANLTADLIKFLAAIISDHLACGGVFISSGILVERKEEIASSIQCSGLEILEIREDGDWCAIAAKRQK